jgi:hypothetical protein
MDDIVRKPYQDGDNGSRPPARKRGRPKGTTGIPHRRTISRKETIKNCRKLVEYRALKLTRSILEEEARLAFSDIRELFDDDGNLLPPYRLPRDVAAAIQSFDVIERSIPRGNGEEPIVTTTYKYKLWDKSSALERLSRHLGLYRADNEQKPKSNVFQQINLNMSDFTEDELETLVRLGGKIANSQLSLPDPDDVIDIEHSL